MPIITNQQILQDCALTYIALLGRNPTVQEYLSAYKDVAINGIGTLPIARKIAQTSEFTATYAAQTTTAAVSLFYANVLQRLPTAGELNAVADMLMRSNFGAMSNSQVANQFYLDVLQRSPTASESAFMTSLLTASRPISKQDLFSTLASSIFSDGGSTLLDKPSLITKVSSAQTAFNTQAQTALVAADQVSAILALANLSSVSVLDQSVNIANNLDSLAALASKISVITPLGPSFSFAITANQLVNDVAALNLIYGPYQLTVSGVATSNMASVLGNSRVTSIALVDTAANIVNNLGLLQANVGKISGITQTDLGVPITVTAAQLNVPLQLGSVPLVLGLISGNYGLAVTGVSTTNLSATLANSHVRSVALSDTATNLANVLDLIQANSGRFASITQTNPGTAMPITASQLSNDWGALNLISNYKVTISDTAANLIANLSSLQQNLSHITNIQVSNSVSLAVTTAQEIANIGALALIQQGGGNYSVKSNVISYKLSATASMMNEGTTENIVLQTTNVANGTSLAYVITGIDPNRVSTGVLSGTVSVDANGQAIIPFSIINNKNTDGITTAVITIGNNLASTSIGILDTSLTPGSIQVSVSPKIPLIINTPNLLVSGTSGIDGTVFAKAQSNFTITVAGSQASVIDKSGGLGTTILSNVERLQFADTMIALDIGKDQTAGSGYMLYKAAFNRTPDVGGLGYWIGKMDTGMGYSSVAQSFVNSTEFKTAFGGSNPTVNTLVTKLYNNVLSRTPDAGGLAFWQDKLNTGWSTADVLGYFATSNENVTNVTPLIANGIAYQQFAG
jgi:hypothetical protein